MSALHVATFCCRAALLLLATLGTLSSLEQVGLAQGTHLNDLFESGNKAFFGGDIESAVQDYETLVEAGVRDPDVYYNLAAAHGRRNQLGFSAMYLERAARLSPNDEDVQSQLRQVREALAKREASRSGEATVRTRPPLRDALLEGISEDALGLALILFEWVCVGAFILRRRSQGETRRLTLLSISLISGLLAVIGAAAFLSKVGVGQVGRPAVVLVPEILREGPDSSAISRGSAPEGSQAAILLSESSWVQVQLDNGPRGWIVREHVGLVSPD